MTWLTDEERQQNRLDDETARKEGFRDAYSKREWEASLPLRKKIEEIKQRVSGLDISLIIEGYKKGLL